VRGSTPSAVSKRGVVRTAAARRNHGRTTRRHPLQTGRSCCYSCCHLLSHFRKGRLDRKLQWHGAAYHNGRSIDASFVPLLEEDVVVEASRPAVLAGRPPRLLLPPVVQRLLHQKNRRAQQYKVRIQDNGTMMEVSPPFTMLLRRILCSSTQQHTTQQQLQQRQQRQHQQSAAAAAAAATILMAAKVSQVGPSTSKSAVRHGGTERSPKRYRRHDHCPPSPPKSFLRAILPITL
jgi:hypothetical protein